MALVSLVWVTAEDRRERMEGVIGYLDVPRFGTEFRRAQGRKWRLC